jgi:hypothetical protein
MLKQHIRWIIPLVLIALVATSMVLWPALSAHAAGAVPNSVWGGK